MDVNLPNDAAFLEVWHAVFDEGTSVDKTYTEGDTDYVVTCLVSVATQHPTIEITELKPNIHTGALPFITLEYDSDVDSCIACIRAYLQICNAAHIHSAYPDW